MLHLVLFSFLFLSTCWIHSLSTCWRFSAVLSNIFPNRVFLVVQIDFYIVSYQMFWAVYETWLYVLLHLYCSRWSHSTRKYRFSSSNVFNKNTYPISGLILSRALFIGIKTIDSVTRLIKLIVSWSSHSFLPGYLALWRLTYDIRITLEF